MKRSKNGFFIVNVYVDAINIIGTHETLEEFYLKEEFEIKGVGRTNFYLGLQSKY